MQLELYATASRLGAPMDTQAMSLSKTLISPAIDLRSNKKIWPGSSLECWILLLSAPPVQDVQNFHLTVNFVRYHIRFREIAGARTS